MDIGGWMAQIIWIHQTHAFISTSRFIYDNVTRNAIHQTHFSLKYRLLALYKEQKGREEFVLPDAKTEGTEKIASYPEKIIKLESGAELI